MHTALQIPELLLDGSIIHRQDEAVNSNLWEHHMLCGYHVVNGQQLEEEWQ